MHPPLSGSPLSCVLLPDNDETLHNVIDLRMNVALTIVSLRYSAHMQEKFASLLKPRQQVFPLLLTLRDRVPSCTDKIYYDTLLVVESNVCTLQQGTDLIDLRQPLEGVIF